MKANRSYIEALATGISEMSGITLVEGNGWKSDIKNKVVTYPMLDLLDMDAGVARGLIVHETGHLMHTGSVAMKDTELEKKYPSIQGMYNTFEDMRVNKKQVDKMGDYARQALEFTNARASSMIIDRIRNNPDKTPDSEGKILQQLLLQDAYTEAYSYAGKSVIRQANNATYEALTPNEHKIVNHIVDSGVIERIKNASDINEVKKLVDTEIFPLFADYYKDKPKESGSDTGKPDSKEANEDEKAESEGEKPNMSKGDESQADTKDGSETKPEKVSKDNSEDAPEGKTHKAKSKSGGSGTHEKKHEDVSLMHMDEDESEAKKATERIGRMLTELPTSNELRSLLAPKVRTTAIELQNILQDQAKTKYYGQYYNGHLLTKNAYKFASGDTKIFSKKDTPDKPNYTVSLVLDESGSMEGDRHKQTYIASVLVEEICKNLGFKTNIVIFSDEIRTAETVEEYRNFQDGGNDDAKAMQAVIDTTNPQDANIVLVLTDGGVCEPPDTQLKIMRELGYTVIAIGVGLGGQEIEDLRRYYKDTIEASDINELPKIMINTFRKLIHR